MCSDRLRCFPVLFAALFVFPVAWNKSTSGIHLYAFQKDERELLLPWVVYHRRLVGARNIHIVDHNSTDIEVMHVLHALEKAGIDVYHFFGKFKDKNRVLTTQMRKCSPNCTAVIPLDIDEFIATRINVAGNDGYTAESNDVTRTLLELPADGRKYKFDGAFSGRLRGTDSLSWRPLAVTSFERTQFDCMSKTFYPFSSFLETDQGNHRGRVRSPCNNRDSLWNAHCKDCFHITNLVLVHYSGLSTTFQSYKNKMLRGARQYGHDQMVDEGKGCKGKGVHYCKFYRATRSEGGHRLRTAFLNKQSRHSYYNDGILHATVESALVGA